MCARGHWHYEILDDVRVLNTHFVFADKPWLHGPCLHHVTVHLAPACLKKCVGGNLGRLFPIENTFYQ
jgi:hypothetical protein